MSSLKDKLHPELKSLPFVAKVISFMMKKKLGFKLFDLSSKGTVGKKAEGIFNDTEYIKSKNGGADIRLRIFRPDTDSKKLPVMLYLHGGGYAMGTPEQSLDILKSFIEKRPCVIVAPGYRKSLQEPYPAAFNDCYDSLLWIRDNADSINGDASKIMIAGHSAGGGLTAALTLKARDTNDVHISFQMPIYPMIDDRHKNESSQFDSPIWSKTSNYLGWKLYLKGLHNQKKDIPTYAAPARNQDYSDFPPTFTFVGGVDPFRDETIEYVENLKNANIPVEFKLYEGCYHGFEILNPETEVAKDAMEFLFTTYATFYDKYFV